MVCSLGSSCVIFFFASILFYLLSRNWNLILKSFPFSLCHGIICFVLQMQTTAVSSFSVSSWIRKQYSYEIFIVCILLSLLLIYIRRLFIYVVVFWKLLWNFRDIFVHILFHFISVFFFFLCLVYLRSLATIIWWFFIVRLANNTRINTTVTFQRTKKGQKINIKRERENILSIKLRTNVQTSYMRDKNIKRISKKKPDIMPKTSLSIKNKII